MHFSGVHVAVIHVLACEGEKADFILFLLLSQAPSSGEVGAQAGPHPCPSATSVP